MKKHTYKKGDIVRIIGNGIRGVPVSGKHHFFEKGEVCTVVREAKENDGDLYLETPGGLHQHVSPKHVELVSGSTEAKKPFFKRLFEKFSQKH